ncbi:MAG: hypothetical protein IPI55_16140 [Flavobacteriales bacterium]|nr:hypothetical protein [Flavobacteriales bacterium]
MYDQAEEHRNGIKWRHAGSLWLECNVHGELLIDVHTLINNPDHWEIRSIEFAGQGDRPPRTNRYCGLVHSKLRNNKALTFYLSAAKALPPKGERGLGALGVCAWTRLVGARQLLVAYGGGHSAPMFTRILSRSFAVPVYFTTPSMATSAL